MQKAKKQEQNSEQEEHVHKNVSLTSQEACKMLNVSRSRISQLTKDGTLAMKDGGISYESVKEYQKNRKAPGRPFGSYTT